MPLMVTAITAGRVGMNRIRSQRPVARRICTMIGITNICGTVVIAPPCA